MCEARQREAADSRQQGKDESKHIDHKDHTGRTEIGRKKAQKSQKEIRLTLRLLRFFAANLFPVRSFSPLCGLCVLCS
jgi:hypothetical protein